MSSGVTVGEGGEGVEETELVRMNQGRLPEGGIGQCQAKESRAGRGWRRKEWELEMSLGWVLGSV